MDIIQVFQRAVSRHGDRVFLFDRQTTITYAQAEARTNAIAAELLERGLGDGDTLGLAASDRVSLWLAIIGAWKANVLPSLIDARTPDDKLPYFLDDIGAKVIVAAPEITDRLKAAGADVVIDIEQVGAAKPTAAINRHGPASPLYLSYTSGTTGLPKGAVLLSEPVTLGTSCIADRLQLTRSDILLATTPISSSFQLVAALMPALHVGASVGLVAGSTIEVIWETALKHQATILVAYPLTLSDIVNAPPAVERKSPFRVALSGGSSLAPRLKRDYRQRLGISLLESYGQSELGGFMVMGAPHDDPQTLAVGFAGRPLADRLAYIGDADGQELPAGEIGEVLVTHGFFDEYRNKPEQTAASKRGGVLHTGDLGISNEDGYIKVVGRVSEADTARQRGGFLREVEDTYYEHEAVQHAVAVAGSNGVVGGFVELKAGQTTPAEQLQQFVAARVPAGLLPQKTIILDKMPRTFSGKADRLTLSQQV